MRDVDVLIVGGGPVGLTASILLSRAGVTSLMVERHPGTAVHPKARAINSRRKGFVRIWAAKSSTVFLCGTAMRAESRP